MQSLNDFLHDNKNININVDNDGVFSGIILKKYYGCDICGFNNNDKVVIHKNDIPYDKLVYVDLHVGYPGIKSIDQHMVTVDEAHNNILSENINKINPNIDYNVTWGQYTEKFPFSTTIYLLARTEGDGKTINDIDLAMPVTNNFRLGDLIWQTDSSCENYFKYNRNASNWIARLKEMSNNGEFTNKLIDWLEKEIPKDPHERGIMMEQIGLWYRINFRCRDNHGSIKEGFIDDKGVISPNLKLYLDTIASLIGTGVVDIENKIFSIKEMRCKSFSYSDVKDRFDSTKLFSYGFIWGMKKDKNIRASYEVI